MQNQPVEQRSIFARKMARELSYEELDAIGGAHGGGGCLSYSYIPNYEVDDSSGDCHIP